MSAKTVNGAALLGRCHTCTRLLDVAMRCGTVSAATKTLVQNYCLESAHNIVNVLMNCLTTRVHLEHDQIEEFAAPLYER